MPAQFSAWTARSVTLVGALLLSTTLTAPAYADIELVVVTAEKRTQDVQTVPIAISVFGSEKRDALGIISIQDMTNFTPGLQYNTSTDRVSLRGVGRLTNVLSADASVANYDDGLYETFAVAAGRSSLDLDRVEVLRGPQGTLYGRNAIAGALNEVTRRPTDEFQAEFRAVYGNYDHETLEGSVSGPIGDNWGYRAYLQWDKQNEGYARNIIPGHASEYFRYNNWYGDVQVQAKFFGGALEMWTKVQSARWYGGAGNAGSQSSGWNPYDTPTYEYGVAVTSLNPGYGCTAPGFTNATANTTVVTATSPLPAATACLNPEVSTPWKIARPIPYDVGLPDYVSVNNQWTLHVNNDFDIKYIVGGTFYHYILTGQSSGGEGSSSDARAPITSYRLTSFGGTPFGLGSTAGVTIFGPEAFNYQEHNGFISNELNFISTNDSPLQWVAGLYWFQQHYNQPVFTTQPLQPQWNQPLGVPGALCAQTGGACAPETDFRRFDNRPALHANSQAAYFQLDYKPFGDELKFTGGLRYSADRKYGVEQVRLLCFALPACFTNPENNFTPFFNLPAVDLTQLGTVVASGVPGPLPKGVTGPTTYDPVTGLAARHYRADWGALTGTAGVEWQPDEQTLVYGKYSRGYKSGGFNVGIFTVLSFSPWTDSEHVDSFEVGAKHTFGDWLVVNTAFFHYAYKNLQIPISIVQTSGGLAQNTTAFFNVPGSISQGAELETTISPWDNLQILFNYSYLDAHVSRGQLADPADPNATAPGAQPALSDAACLADFLALVHGGIGGAPICSPDIYTSGIAPNAAHPLGGPGGVGWNKPQNISGDTLPNAPRNKIAINVLYTWKTDFGSFSPSVSYVWRDAQYGSLFTRSYYKAPAWDQWDARLRYISTDDKWEAILFGRNIFNTIGYDSGAEGMRLAGSIVNNIASGAPGTITNFVQGVNGPAGYGAVRGEDATGHVTTYYVTPPAVYGIEVHYKL